MTRKTLKHTVKKLPFKLKSSSFTSYHFNKSNLIIFSLVFAAIGAYIIYSSFAAGFSTSFEAENTTKYSPATTVADASASGGSALKFGAAGSVSCDLNATPANFTTQISAATSGQTVCLATGNYGTWTGTSKSITVRNAAGASPTMMVNFDTGVGNFTLSGITIGDGQMVGSSAPNLIASGAHDITIRDSNFTSQIIIRGTTASANILLDHNTHNDIFSSCWQCEAGRVEVAGGGLTIQNSMLKGGDSDGIQIGSTLQVKILNNELYEICEKGINHTDFIQWFGGTNSIVRGNWLHSVAPCATQVLSAFDSTAGNLIEDNVVDTNSRPWSIELYSDESSIVRHNTFVYGSCDFSLPCGQIGLDHKSTDDPSRGTEIYDNIATRLDNIGNEAVARRDHNMMRTTALSGDFLGTPVFAGGGAHPTSYAGYRLAPGSPGKGAASDGLDVGIH
jgi:hypothetical protein